MNWKKLIPISCIAATVFTISTPMAAQRTMQTAPMHRAHRSSPARAPMMTNSTSGFHRFNDRSEDRFGARHPFFNDRREDRIEAFRHDRFRDRFIFADTFFDPFFFGFGFPFFGFGFPFYASYYYPYAYGYYNYGSSYGASGYSASIVVEVQTQLSRAGYYHGRIDGVMGPRTRYAIRTYERAHGLRVDGVISQQLVATMGLRANGGGY